MSPELPSGVCSAGGRRSACRQVPAELAIMLCEFKVAARRVGPQIGGKGCREHRQVHDPEFAQITSKAWQAYHSKAPFWQSRRSTGAEMKVLYMSMYAFVHHLGKWHPALDSHRVAAGAMDADQNGTAHCEAARSPG